MGNIIRNINLVGKTILNIGPRQNVLNYLEKEKPHCVYSCKNITECKKNIKTEDVVVIDDYFENEEQYILLKKMVQFIIESDLKSNFELIIIKSEIKKEDEKTEIYKNLIDDYLEAMVKFKGLNKQLDIKNGIDNLNIFRKETLLV